MTEKGAASTKEPAKTAAREMEGMTGGILKAIYSSKLCIYWLVKNGKHSHIISI